MDSSILQIFSVEEILEKIARKQLTGCFHVFTPRESATVFFKDGLVATATLGDQEGEEVLASLLSWNGARCVWEPNAVAPTASTTINLRDFLARKRPGVEAYRRKMPEVIGPANPALKSRPVINVAARGKSTGQLENPAAPSLTESASLKRDMMATKTFDPSGEDRAAQDEALLQRHRLALVSADNPSVRVKIARISCLIGRSPACDIPIPDPSISRQHCMVQITERGLQIKDLDTTNGTKVNGTTLKEGVVNVGDRLTIGHLHFILEKE